MYTGPTVANLYGKTMQTCQFADIPSREGSGHPEAGRSPHRPAALRGEAAGAAAASRLLSPWQYDGFSGQIAN